jgi:hypothetical protein
VLQFHPVAASVNHIPDRSMVVLLFDLQVFTFPHLPGLLTNSEMAQRSIPALKTCGAKRSVETGYLDRNRAQRIPSWPGEHSSPTRPNTFARTNLPTSLFTCRRAANYTFVPPFRPCDVSH